MTKLQELRAKRDTLTAAAGQHLNAFANKQMGKEDVSRYDEMIADITSIDAEISHLLDSQASATLEMQNANRPSADTWAAVEGKPVRVMRNAKDFRAHYATRSDAFNLANQSDQFGLADVFRAVGRVGPTSQGIQAALSVGTNTAGGFSVPSFLMPEILEALVPQSALLSAGAGIVDLPTGGKTFTTAVINAIPTSSWRNESAAVAESDPTFRAVTATPQSLAFFFKVSRELLADGQNIEPALRTAIAQSFARELDRVGLRGSGTAPQPRGILNTAGIQSVTNGANGASLAGYANFFTGVQAILGADAPMPTAAIMHPRSQVKLGGLLDTTNQPISIPPMLQPVRMLATSQIPINLTVGTSNDCSEIYLGDFTRCAFTLRENVSVQLLNELYAGTGEIGFLCHVRADFVCWYPAGFAVVTGVRA
jgi:HK97 family phage major capsid protein